MTRPNVQSYCRIWPFLSYFPSHNLVQIIQYKQNHVYQVPYQEPKSTKRLIPGTLTITWKFDVLTLTNNRINNLSGYYLEVTSDVTIVTRKPQNIGTNRLKQEQFVCLAQHLNQLRKT
jgi:hypothetical protein